MMVATRSKAKPKRFNKVQVLATLTGALLAWVVFLFGSYVAMFLISMSESPYLGDWSPQSLADYATYLIPLAILTPILGVACYLTIKAYGIVNNAKLGSGTNYSPAKIAYIAMIAFVMLGSVSIVKHGIDINNADKAAAYAEHVRKYLDADYSSVDVQKGEDKLIYRHDGVDGPQSTVTAQQAYVDFGNPATDECATQNSIERATVFERNSLKKSDRALGRDKIFEGYFSWYTSAESQMHSVERINDKDFDIRHYVDEQSVKYGCPKEDIYYATYADDTKFLVIVRQTKVYENSKADFTKFVGSFKNL